MLVKKYVGKSIEQIERAINDELGPDAIVLMTRNVDKGILSSIVGSDEIEVTVGIEKEALEKHNPNYGSFEEFEALTLAPFHASTHVDCSGAISPDPSGVSLIAIVGLNEPTLGDTCLRLMRHFRKETQFRAALLLIKQYHQKESSLDATFKSNEIAFDNIIDRFTLLDRLKHYKDFDFVVACFPSVMHPTQIKTFLDGVSPRSTYVVASEEEELGAYKILYPQGLILNNLQKSTAFHLLPQLFEKLKIPVGYMVQEERLLVCKPDELEALIINSRLNS